MVQNRVEVEIFSETQFKQLISLSARKNQGSHLLQHSNKSAVLTPEGQQSPNALPSYVKLMSLSQFWSRFAAVTLNEIK